MNTPIIALSILSFGLILSAPLQQQDESEFTSGTIDIGMVVSDIEASAKFYRETLGLAEVTGFDVDEEFCRDAGLTDSLPLSIRMFVVGDGPAATKLKLMEVEGAEPAKADNAFVHSQLGLSYLTIYVRDMTRALQRLEAASVKPLGKGPVAIGEGRQAPQLILVRDPDGNLIELIGPRL